jgi:membrane-associated phospholipid phosphatase
LELSDKVKLKPSDGGMPSSHAMSLSFIGTVILLGVIVPATLLLLQLVVAAAST